MYKFVLAMSMMTILVGGSAAFAQEAAVEEAPATVHEATKVETKDLTEGKKPGSVKSFNEAALKQQKSDADLKRRTEVEDVVVKHIESDFEQISSNKAKPENVAAIKAITEAARFAGSGVLDVNNETDMQLVANLSQFPKVATVIAGEITDAKGMLQKHPEATKKYLRSMLFAATAENGSANSVIKRGMTKIYLNEYSEKALETFAEGWHSYGLKLKRHELVGKETFIRAVAEAFGLDRDTAAKLVDEGCFFGINA